VTPDTDVRTVPEADLAAFHRLHDEYVDRDASLATVRAWHDEHPDLLVGAYRDGELVGHAIGRPWEGDVVQLAAIAVVPELRAEGVGTALLEAFHDRARAAGFDRVTLGSAGGYVDEFYHDNGYEATQVLVMFADDAAPEDPVDLAVTWEPADDGGRKCYVDVDGFEPDTLAAARAAFPDGEAMYVMERALGP
jgi:predicted N-acetyltransferase YhbS